MKRTTLHIPRWLWLNHVPAGLELTPEQQDDMRRRVRSVRSTAVRGRGVTQDVFKRVVPGTIVLSTMFVVWIMWLVGARLPTGRYVVANTFGIVIFQALVWLVIAWSINRAMAPIVWRVLNQMGFRVCEGCGYILDYLPRETAKCPECGEALHPPTDAPS